MKYSIHFLLDPTKKTPLPTLNVVASIYYDYNHLQLQHKEHSMTRKIGILTGGGDAQDSMQ